MPSNLVSSLSIFGTSLLVMLQFAGAHAEELDRHFTMSEQSWNEDGDIEFEGEFLEDGLNSWGNRMTTDFYMQTTSANAMTDIYLPTAQEVVTSRAVTIEFDARYLTAGSHNYVSFGNDGELENAIWFGFNNSQFSAGTGSELAVSNNQPASDLVEFARDRTLPNDRRIGVRIGYDAPNESLRNFQIDTDNDGNYETELLDAPVDFSGAGLVPEEWYFLSYFGGENSRIDDIFLKQIDLYGDYNVDLDFDSEDVELICNAIADENLDLDFDQNGQINSADLDAFLKANLSLPGDFDFNAIVDFADFLQLSGAFGKTDAVYGDGDISCDGTVGFEDFLILSGNFNRLAGGAPVAVPEPSTHALLAIALLVMLGLRRRQ